MERIILTPENTDLHLLIPPEYVGIRIEVTIKATEEVLVGKIKKSMSSLRGRLNLTTEQYSDFNEYLNNSRNEWNRDI